MLIFAFQACFIIAFGFIVLIILSDGFNVSMFRSILYISSPLTLTNGLTSRAGLIVVIVHCILRTTVLNVRARVGTGGA